MFRVPAFFIALGLAFFADYIQTHFSISMACFSAYLSGALMVYATLPRNDSKVQE